MRARSETNLRRGSGHRFEFFCCQLQISFVAQKYFLDDRTLTIRVKFKLAVHLSKFGKARLRRNSRNYGHKTGKEADGERELHVAEAKNLLK